MWGDYKYNQSNGTKKGIEHAHKQFHLQSWDNTNNNNQHDLNWYWYDLNEYDNSNYMINYAMDNKTMNKGQHNQN